MKLRALVLFSLLSGCFPGATLADGGALTPMAPPSPFASGVSEILLEVDYAAGAEPFTRSSLITRDPWELFRVNFERVLLQGTAGRRLVYPSSLSAMQKLTDANGADFTTEQILNLAAKHRTQASTKTRPTFYALWLNGYYRDDSGQRRDVLGVSIGETSVMALFKPVIGSGASAQYVEQTTLIHELGHALGLVNNGIVALSPHHDQAHGAHCTNADCVMYWLNESPSELSAFVQRSVLAEDKVLFGKECLADVDAIRKQ